MPALSLIRWRWSVLALALALLGAEALPDPMTAPDQALVAAMRRNVAALGVYKAHLERSERVDGKMVRASADVWVQDAAPRAVRMRFSTGRLVLWNASHRPGEILVREGGLLGLTTVWLDMRGGLARRESNHTAAEVGFAPLLELVAGDLDKVRALGAHRRVDLGTGADGLRCVRFDAPPGAAGLYARSTLLCFDRALGLPLRVEVHDDQGLRETYTWTAVAGGQKLGPSFFTPANL